MDTGLDVVNVSVETSPSKGENACDETLTAFKRGAKGSRRTSCVGQKALRRVNTWPSAPVKEREACAFKWFSPAVSDAAQENFPSACAVVSPSRAPLSKIAISAVGSARPLSV